jgi:hypothetical protein
MKGDVVVPCLVVHETEPLDPGLCSLICCSSGLCAPMKRHVRLDHRIRERIHDRPDRDSIVIPGRELGSQAVTGQHEMLAIRGPRTERQVGLFLQPLGVAVNDLEPEISPEGLREPRLSYPWGS